MPAPTVPFQSPITFLGRTFFKNAVQHDLTFAPQGVSAPLMVFGDPTSAYFTLARTGVGTFTLTTVNAYPALPAKNGIVPLPILEGSVSLATPAGQWNVCAGLPTQNASTHIWTMPFTLFSAATATDIAAATGNLVNLYVVLPMDLNNP
jgi:hypothetical protein